MPERELKKILRTVEVVLGGVTHTDTFDAGNVVRLVSNVDGRVVLKMIARNGNHRRWTGTEAEYDPLTTPDNDPKWVGSD